MFLSSITAPLLLASLAHAQARDPWATFNSNIKACTVIDKVYSALPAKTQDAVLTFCNSFVGYTTTTVTGQTDVWVTSPIPLKTVTVKSKPRPRYMAIGEEELHEPEAPNASPTLKRITPTGSTSTITPPPIAPMSLELHHELKRAKFPTPAVFKNQASLAIRTGCACLGFATQPTIPVFTTTTATSTVPASCALAPASAYHVSSYSPASAAAVAYEYGWFSYYEPSPDPLGECCKDCQGRGGCVQFVYEKQDPVRDGAYARCNFLYLDDYGENKVTGVPRLANETPYSCLNGYLAVNGLVRDTSSTTVSSATFLGPCAVTTVRR
ncbi:hypothetical protein BKA66DRAFT_471027 [Pyrenochaeta sp. MPI-SDFR-AT-0127]|nr:hypothetical protein BKA66DRAFT_471027 [Pyrenochaeta sp. MPI-SDFR-AT-0127]